MVRIEGETGKSIIVDALQKSRNARVYVYDKEPVDSLDACFVSSKYFTTEEFFESVKRDLTGTHSLPADMVVLYTNSPDCNVYGDFWSFAQELEEQNYAVLAVVASR